MNSRPNQDDSAEETAGQGGGSVWSDLGKMLAERIEDLAREYDT